MKITFVYNEKDYCRRTDAPCVPACEQKKENCIFLIRYKEMEKENDHIANFNRSI